MLSRVECFFGSVLRKAARNDENSVDLLANVGKCVNLGIDGFEALFFGVAGDGVLHKVTMREQGMWIAIIAFNLVHHPLE